MAPQRHEHHATHTYFDQKPHPTLAGKTAATASFVVICFAGILATTHLIGTRLPFMPEYKVSAIVPDAEGVIPASEVTIGGAAAGRVDEVSLTPQGARITVSLYDRWQHIHRDATASIRIKSLLGERFVDIDPGSPAQPEVPSGSTLRQKGTLSVELTDVLNMLDPHTRADLGMLISSMATSTAGRETDINAAIRDLRTLVADLGPATESVASRAADVRHLIDRADRVTGDLASEQGSLGSLVDKADASLRSLSSDRAPLLRVIDQGDRLSEGLSAVLDPRTQQGIRDALQEAPPTLGQTSVLGTTLTPTVQQVRTATPSLLELIPALRSTLAFTDANGHYIRVFLLDGGPNNLATTENGDRRPAPNAPRGREGDQAPGFPGSSGAPAGAAIPDMPLWNLVFGGI